MKKSRMQSFFILNSKFEIRNSKILMTCKYFIPGPTWVRPELLQEMTRPMIGHRSADFKALFARVVPDLKMLFGTAQDVFVATCSGTAIMEAALLNTAKQRVLVTTCGAFSERWMTIAESIGLEVDRLDAGWGNAVDAGELADHLRSRRVPYDAVTITHNETSTGVTNDVASLSSLVPLSAATDLPAQQQMHRSGCAMHPRGNAHHVGQPD